jgi:hypothetical protein
MGFFSWRTSDTNRSIPNIYSEVEPFTVHMITEDGQVFTEHEYNGYGEFGGKDFYELLAELNGITEGDTDSKRCKGIDLFYDKTIVNLKQPKLVEKLPSKDKWKEEWDNLDYPVSCEYQGYFY